MNVVVAERGATERELDLEIPGESLSTLLEAKIETYRKKINLPGFRPGKLPKDVVKKRFGASIRSEAIEELVDTSIRQALTDKKILPVAPGSVSSLDAPESGPIKLKYLFEVDPVIELKDYKGLGISIEKTSVSDADVAARILEIQNQTAEVTSPSALRRPPTWSPPATTRSWWTAWKCRLRFPCSKPNSARGFQPSTPR